MMAAASLALLSAAAAAAASGSVAQRPLPARRSVMTLLVQHRTQFPEYVSKIAETRGGINVAAPICFNPGHMAPTTNLSVSIYCLDDFLVPMRAKVPTITQHPMIQMANDVLLYNLKHYGWTVKAFKQVAMAHDDLIDGFLFYPQLASKVGSTGDYKALRTFLDEFADELHSINKTLGVFTPNYHSKFSPAAVLQDSKIDYWLTNLEVKSCAEVASFYKALHGHGLSSKGGGTLFTSDGAFNSAGCMDQLFPPKSGSATAATTGAAALSNATAIGFYTDFSSMGNLWWPPLVRWIGSTGAGATLKTDDDGELNAAAATAPIITLHYDTDNVAGAPWRSSSAGGGSIQYLGLYNSTEQCQWACLAGPPPQGKHCCSFTFHTVDWEPNNPHGWNRQCFGVTNGHWVPAPLANITSGRVKWPAGTAASQACSQVPSLYQSVLL